MHTFFVHQDDKQESAGACGSKKIKHFSDYIRGFHGPSFLDRARGSLSGDTIHSYTSSPSSNEIVQYSNYTTLEIHSNPDQGNTHARKPGLIAWYHFLGHRMNPHAVIKFQYELASRDSLPIQPNDKQTISRSQSRIRIVNLANLTTITRFSVPRHPSKNTKSGMNN